MKRVKSWAQLLTDPRVSEVWSEDNDGTDWWVALKAPWQTEDGTSCIHEWSKAACINELNSAVKDPSSDAREELLAQERDNMEAQGESL